MEKKGKKRLEGLEELDESFDDDIYKEFEEEKPVNNSIDNSNDNVQNSGIKNEHYEYKEKEYNSGFLESHTVETTTRKISKAFLFVFYAIVLVVGIGLFVMLREDRYRFYLKNDEVTIGNGSNYQVEIIPKNDRYFDYLKYNYEIGDTSVATVDEYGRVTAVGKGTTDLKISLKYGLSSKTMKIITEDINVDSIQLKVDVKGNLITKDTIEMQPNESITIHALGNNRDDLNLSVNYTSSNPDVAVVDDFGNVTAKSAGEATITGSKYGIDGSVKIVVKGKGSQEVPSINPTPTIKPGTNPTPTSVPGNPTSVPKPTITPKPVKPTTHVQTVDIGITSTSKYEGETLQLTARVTPDNANGYPVTWSSSNESVATVDKNGLVTAKSVGTAVIKAVVDGKEASGRIFVRKKTNTPTITPKPTITLKPTTKPSVTTAPSGSTPQGTTTFNTKYAKGSTLSLTVNKGKTATFDISLINAVGKIKVASEDSSIATVSESEFWLESTDASKADSKTITVSGKKAGTVKINVDLDDVSTFDTVQTLSGRHTIVVTVK